MSEQDLQPVDQNLIGAFFRLLDLRHRQEGSMDETLLQLSLLNLLGIISLLDRRLEVGSVKQPAEAQNILGSLMDMLGAGNGASGGPSLNPAALLNMISQMAQGGAGQGGKLNPAALLSMLSALNQLAPAQPSNQLPEKTEKKEEKKENTRAEVEEIDEAPRGMHREPPREVRSSRDHWEVPRESFRDRR